MNNIVLFCDSSDVTIRCEYVIIRLFFVPAFCEMIISILKKVLLQFLTRYLTLYHLSPAMKKRHSAPMFLRNLGYHAMYLHEENNSIKLQTWHGMKSKSVMFASEHTTEYLKLIL